MLYTIKKYTYVTKFQHSITLVQNVNKKLYISKRLRRVIYSTFFKKLYFRSLLLSINNIYSNYFLPIDTNYFYSSNYIISQYSFIHPSFYFKKMVVK